MINVCRLELTPTGIQSMDKLEDPLEDLTAIIQSDKKFGAMIPKNGVITWGLLNTDVEISYEAAKQNIAKAFAEWALYVPISFKYTKDFNNADVQILFRSIQQDKNLTGTTIAYAYYPSSKLAQIVINTGFIFTQVGMPLKGTDVEKLGIRVQYKDAWYITTDLDKVIRHELGHKLFGLQHDPVYWNTMSNKEPVMSEHIEERDILRAQAKVGKRKIEESKFKRLLAWVFSASERKY